METHIPNSYELHFSSELRYIRMKETCHKTGLSKSSIYDLMNAGAFPKTIKLGGRSVAFVEAEVNAWMAERLTASRDLKREFR
ncbi:helix-turn-helix transcriptional regulator [Aeromonas allosaccharophila]|uniref:helix-turn-helix transcriptional regulator n=2 Tax=Aeromonadaceae TaxID=84642 RepID=UPI002B483057|nr:AlpA family transcriptional regulator [Aeromonas allosaccharophila]